MYCGWGLTVIQEEPERMLACLVGRWFSTAAPCMLEPPRLGWVGRCSGVTSSPQPPPPCTVRVWPVQPDQASNPAPGLEDLWQPPPPTCTVVPSDTPGRNTLQLRRWASVSLSLGEIPGHQSLTSLSHTSTDVPRGPHGPLVEDSTGWVRLLTMTVI